MTEAECTGEKLYEKTMELLSQPQKLQEMGVCASKLAVLDSAEKIYQAILEASR